MQRDILLFAGAKQAVGRDTVTIEVPDDSTAADILAALAAQYSELASLLPSSRLAVDSTYVSTDAAVIAPDSEVALIPPVSGG